MSEFSRMIDARHLPAGPQRMAASPEECAALARRFDLVAVQRLEAELTLHPEGPSVRAEGRLAADIVQSCAVSGEDLPVSLSEAISLRFVPQGLQIGLDAELELDAAQCDEIEMDNSHFDLGEAVAQGMALAIDPYAVGPKAAEVRRRAGLLGEGNAGPFAALAALKKDN